MKIAVIGNSAINAGTAVAADLALAGHDVRFAMWPGGEDLIEAIRRKGGLELAGRVAHARAGRGGLARTQICDALAEAAAGAEIVVLDMPAPEFESKFALLVDHLAPGQIVHVNLHGYWPALRLAPLLRDAGRADVTITEGSAPTHAAARDGAVVRLEWVRRRVPVAAFPANRAGAALDRLQRIFPHIEPAQNVLQTGFAGLNMMIHAPLVLPNVGWCDRALAAGETVHLYDAGATEHAGRLAEAQDAERAPVCAAFGVACRSLADHLRDYYEASGETVREIVGDSVYYRELSPYPADAWRRWLLADIPHAFVPLCDLAARAGVETPLHRAMVAIAGALLGRDFWREGVTLAKLGLGDAGVADIRRYVETGAQPQ
jgi:opine dehydrogenase